MIRLSAPESAALGCTHVVEVALVVGEPEPEFFCYAGDWMRNVFHGAPAKDYGGVEFVHARPATEEEIANVAD